MTRKTEKEYDSDDMNIDTGHSGTKTNTSGNLFELKNPLVYSAPVPKQSDLPDEDTVMDVDDREEYFTLKTKAQQKFQW